MTDRQLLELLVQKVTGIETKVAGIESKVSDIDSRVTGIETKVSDIDSRVTGIESKVATMEHDIASIKSDVSGLKRDMGQVMQAVIETNDAVKRIEAAQSKTETELNTHSYSIEILNREQFYLKTEIEKLKNR